MHADHLPPLSPAQAIAYSCNYYFATLGQRLGREKLFATAREFGDGILVALSDPVRSADLGARAVRLAETKYSYEAYLDKTRRACAALAPDSRTPLSAVKDVV